MTSSCRIAVVGAGLAGLTAAYRLFQMGCNVELYEARARVGGRVFSVHLDGQVVEVGGQNIHDGDQAPHLMRLVHELGLETIACSIPHHGWYVDGTQKVKFWETLAKHDLDPDALRQRLKQLSESCSNLQEILDKLFPDDSTLKDILARRLGVYEGALPEELSVEMTEALYYPLVGGLSTVHPERDVIKYRWIKGGNARLPEAMAHVLGTRLHTAMPLQEIQRTESGGYQLHFQNGLSASCELLVLALPCPVYHSLNISESVIPPERLARIAGLKYGINAKIVVPLPHPPSDMTFYVTPEVVMYFPGSRQQAYLYYGGHNGSFTRKTMTQVFERDRWVLELIASGVDGKASPVLVEDRNFASYGGPIAHSWPDDPYAGGSYSFLAAGQEDFHAPIRHSSGILVKETFAPIHDSLFFAGEHCSLQMEIGGTMEAAVESGEDAVKLIQHALVNVHQPQ